MPIEDIVRKSEASLELRSRFNVDEFFKPLEVMPYSSEMYETIMNNRGGITRADGRLQMEIIRNARPLFF